MQMETKMKTSTVRNRFQKFGRGVFTCHCCKRQTRETTGDHGQLDLCEDCFELAGIENSISDADDAAKVIREYRKEVRRRTNRVEKRGGSLQNWQRLLTVCESIR